MHVWIYCIGIRSPQATPYFRFITFTNSKHNYSKISSPCHPPAYMFELISLPSNHGGWRGSWHCLSGEHLLCILFSRPESRKTACAGRFESYGCQPIMLKITAWLVGRWICEWRRQPRKRLRLDLGLFLGPDSSRAAPVTVADGIVLGSDHGR